MIERSASEELSVVEIIAVLALPSIKHNLWGLVLGGKLTGVQWKDNESPKVRRAVICFGLKDPGNMEVSGREKNANEFLLAD